MVAINPKPEPMLVDRPAVDAALTRLEKWLTTRDGAQLECKEAKSRYDFEKMVTYSITLHGETTDQLRSDKAAQRTCPLRGPLFSQASRGSPLPDAALSERSWTTDPAFVRFLQAASERAGSTFGLHDLLALDALHRGATQSDHLRERPPRLEEVCAIERLGGGQVILARSLYQELGKAGVYTRRKGLDRHTNLELLVKHIADSGDQGAPLTELMQVLPSATRSQVQGMLRDLRSAGRIQQRGRTRGGRWFIVVPKDQP